MGLNLSADNFSSPIGGFGEKVQRVTDPLSWMTGGKWARIASDDIPRASNEALSKVVQPFAQVDKTINPVRQMFPEVDSISTLAEKKPASALGMAAGAIFGGGALAGLGGGGAGAGIGGSAGGGLPAAGAAGAGGSIPSAGLAGIFPGATVPSATATAGGTGGLFGGTAAGMGAAGTAPAITGSASLFSGGSSLSARDRIIAQMANQFAGQQNQRANQYRGQIR